MNKAVIALLGVSALALSTASIAGGTTTVPSDNMDANNAAGFYVSGNLGYGDVDVKKPSLSVPGTDITTTRDGVAWSGAVGYQFNPYVAVEGGYIQFSDVKVKLQAPNASVSVTTKTKGVDLAVKGIYPINEQFNVFGKVGLVYLSHTLSHTGTVRDGSVSLSLDDTDHHIVPLFGVGASYNITQNWAVDLQGIVTTKSGDNFPATYTGLVGLTYKFS